MTAPEETHKCQHEGCENDGDPCYIMGDDEPSHYYCIGHMYEEGFCPGCNLFWSGVESFDFSPAKLCSNCKDNIDYELSDDDYFDEDDWDYDEDYWDED
jgi:hypothetical protein